MPAFFRLLRKATLAAGFVVCVIALVAANVGLGTGPDFLFFRWWHITRTTTLYSGLLLIFASLIPDLRGLKAPWSKLRAAIVKELAFEAGPQHIARFLLLGSVQLMLAVTVATAAFWLNRNNLLGYFDGQNLMTLSKNQWDFTSFGFEISSNPLQALGDIWPNLNARWIPELLVLRLFSETNWQKIAIHCVAFTEIFTATSLVAYWLDSSPAKSIASGWLAALMISPITFPSLIYNVSPDLPLGMLIALPLAIVPLWGDIGRKSFWSDATRTAIIGLLLWIHFIAMGLFSVLAYPFLAIIGLVFLITSWNDKVEFWRKLALGCVLFLVLVISGLPQIQLGMIADSAFYIFPQEYGIRRAHGLEDGSLLLRPNEPIGFCIAALGVSGAICHLIWGRAGRMRQFAIATLAAVGLILCASLAYAKKGFSGAIPIYYEWVLWAVYPIFAISMLAIGWNQYWSQWSSSRGRHAAVFPKWLWLVLPLAGLLALHGPNYLRGGYNSRPNVYPPAPTTLTEYLRGEVALIPGAPFRGRVATITGESLPAPARWQQLWDIDIRLINSVGNDHRDIGLWYFSIPTLFQYSMTMHPLFYAVVKRYLTFEGDVWERNVAPIRRADIGILRLLGVRYLITDNRTPAPGSQRLREMSLPGGGTLAIDEIAMPNLGLSPTQTMPITSGRQAIDWLGNAQADFGRTALLTGPKVAELSPASDISIIVERDGIRVLANSLGHSLVVIPFQFSNCLQVVPRDNSRAPDLRRANLLLTGLLFEGRLDATIKYRQAPFQGTFCRLKDLEDDMSLVESLGTKR